MLPSKGIFSQNVARTIMENNCISELIYKNCQFCNMSCLAEKELTAAVVVSQFPRMLWGSYPEAFLFSSAS